MIDLKIYVPELLKEIKEFSALYEVDNKELNDILTEIYDIFSQCRIKTATWGLVYWEELFGITTDLSLSYEERREALIARKTGHGTATISKIKDIARSFTGGEIEVIENSADYSFVIKFISQKGIPSNLEAFKDAIDKIKPSHLAYTLQFLYNTWGMLKNNNRTWGSVSDKTWDEIRTQD